VTERTLVVILCETRAGHITFERFRRHVLDVFDADLALCVAENDREDRSNPFYRAADHVWTSPEYDDWGVGIERYTPNIHPRWRELAEFGPQWLGGVRTDPPHPGSGGILWFFRAFLRHQIAEAGLTDHYDRFIITRSDFVHEIPVPPPELVDNRYVWIPAGESHGGYTDRFISCPAAHIDQALAVTELFTADPSTTAELMRGRTWNPERILKHVYDTSGLSDIVRPMPYTMYSIREEGGHTSWAAGRYSEELGLYVKYPTELRSARFARAVLRGGDWTATRFTVVTAVQQVRVGLRWLTRPFRRPPRSRG